MDFFYWVGRFAAGVAVVFVLFFVFAACALTTTHGLQTDCTTRTTTNGSIYDMQTHSTFECH